MGIEEFRLVNGHLTKNGCYLIPITPDKFEADSYAIADIILDDRMAIYKDQRPLMIPLGRGGYRTFLPMHGRFRSVLRTKEDKKDIPYESVKTQRCQEGEINVFDELKIDEQDIEKVLKALKHCSEGIIIDDVCDRGTSIEGVRILLNGEGKPVIRVAAHTKKEAHPASLEPEYAIRNYKSKEIEGQRFFPWLVYPHEREDHGKKLWEIMFPKLCADSKAAYEELVAA